MKKDGSWKVYFSDPSRYADAINGFGCNGEQVVHAEDLQEMDEDEYVEEGKADMCKAIKDLMEDSRIEGRLEGEILGRASGMIVILRKYQVADDEIIQQLVEELEIDEEKAKEYLKNIG